MCDIRYFKRARHAYDTAVLVIPQYQADELYIYTAAYHLQQSVEQTLKAFLECKGVTVPETHQISKLLRMTADNGSACIITPWIEENAVQLSEWESNTRYNFDYYLELDFIKKGIAEIGKFLCINGLTNDPDPELTKERKSVLLTLIPKDQKDADNFTMNIYFHVFRKQIDRNLRKTDSPVFDMKID